MRRRALLTTLLSTGSVALAGCNSLGDDALDDGDTVELPEGRVTVGYLGFRSSFVDDTTAPATVHGEPDRGYVTLACDCRDYDAPIDDLPFGVDVNGESVVGDTLVFGAGDGRPTLGLPVPTGDSVESAAVVVENAYDRERRYPFPQRVRDRLATPATWRVDVDPPERVPSTGDARAWVTATNTGDAPGRLDALLTHDAADELYWTHDFDAPSNGTETFGYRFQCLCSDRDELTVTLDWGFDDWTGTVPVES